MATDESEHGGQAELQRVREALFEEIDETRIRVTFGDPNFDITEQLKLCGDQALRLQQITKRMGRTAERQSNPYFDHIRLTRTSLLQLQDEAVARQVKQAQIEAQLETQKLTSTRIAPIALCPDDFRLTPFDGVPCHYRQFEQMFESVYESNQSISGGQLFIAYYNLIGQKGRQVVGSVPPTKDGLKTAKERMKEHFDDGFRVRTSIRQSLEALPQVKNASSTESLRQLLHAFEDGVQLLLDCGTDHNVINHAYLPLVLPKLPRSTLKSYIEKRDIDAFGLIKFLRETVRLEQQLNELGAEPANIRVRAMNTASTSATTPSTFTSASPINPQDASSIQPADQCLLCEGTHKTIYCKTRDATFRTEMAKTKKLCFRCLRANHTVSNCRSNFRCSCGGNHSTALCMRNTSPNVQANVLSVNHESPATNSDSSSSARDGEPIQLNFVQAIQTQNVSSLNDHTKLKTHAPTFLVKIEDTVVRVLLDTGADRSIISDALADRLKLSTVAHHSIPIRGFEGTCSYLSKRSVNAKLCALPHNYQLEATLISVPNMPSLRCAALTSSEQQTLAERGYVIQDITIDQLRSIPIDIILGQDYCWEIGPLAKPTRINNHLYVIATQFGWIVSGVTWKNEPIVVRRLAINNDALNEIHVNSSHNDQRLTDEYLQEFMSNKITFHERRYHTKLPWITPIELNDNFTVAWKRFQRLLNSLRARNLFDDYNMAINDMIQHFAEPVHSDLENSGKIYYLPHHAVIRSDKSTSKIRIVFDGSSHDTGCRSLNDCLFKGSTNWDSLSLLIRFRFGGTAIVADLKQAFLQIGIDADDRDALRFWWVDDNGHPKVFRFKAVPFGTSASPFLLYAVMQHHFRLHADEFSDVIQLIQSNFYVDDLLLAFSDFSEVDVQRLKDRTVELFNRASMTLCKWRTNNRTLDTHWTLDATDTISVLGHRWNVHSDKIALNIDITQFQDFRYPTKRQFASFASSIYDPIGLVLPFTIQLRLFLRKVWATDTKWDDPIPDEHREEALQLINDAVNVNNVSVLRNVMDRDDELHLRIYGDASQSALGAVAYCISKNQSFLLAARGKLARDASTPALELDAIMLARSLGVYLQNIYSFTSITIFSDSLLNLQRLLKHPNNQRPAIALKINQIKKLGPARYRHVTSQNNPADLISRGCSMLTLLSHSKWWSPDVEVINDKFDEEINVQIFPIGAGPVLVECECRAANTYKDAIRFFEIIAKFIIKSGNRLSRFQQQTHEFALVLLLRTTQRMHFQSEIEDINRGSPIDRASPLRNYRCFIDNQQLLRIRTRLEEHNNLTYNEVCPILLPRHCRVSRLIVRSEHSRLAHAGIARVVEAVRERYFIIGITKIAAKVSHQCTLCRRIRAQSVEHPHGMIPVFRYDQEALPFTNTGLDIFGPIKANLISREKRYGLIFTCATTRAVHLELLKSITAESVLRALRKFIARRGFPHLLYSDNGTQLLAIKRRLLELIEQLNTDHPDFEIRFRWLNSTIASPWRGGFYERLIRTVKQVLTTMTFRKSIDDDELETILVIIEGHMNSRPLFTYNGQAISPSAFFMGKTLNQLPPVSNDVSRRLTRDPIIDEFLKNQRRVNSLWRTWRSQYLLQLRQFHQNTTNSTPSNFKIGDIAILKNAASIDRWPLVIIVALGPQPDGIVRTVDVRTLDHRQEVLRMRSTKTLIPLECDREIIRS